MGNLEVGNPDIYHDSVDDDNDSDGDADDDDDDGNVVNVRIAHLRIAHWGAILRWAILSPSVIRIAHPNHKTFFTLLVWFGVLATDSGWFSMLFTCLIEYTASYCS